MTTAFIKKKLIGAFTIVSSLNTKDVKQKEVCEFYEKCLVNYLRRLHYSLDMYSYSKHSCQLLLNIWLSHQMTTKIQKSIMFVSRFLILSHTYKVSSRPGEIDFLFRYFILTTGNKNPRNQGKYKIFELAFILSNTIYVPSLKYLIDSLNNSG